MPKSPRQKQKLLALQQIFFTQTDQDHPLTAAQLIEELGRYDIVAERKSIYNDVEQLQQFGMDIIHVPQRGYYLASREFELAELKLLADSVQSSKFITYRKTLSLIDKIERLTNRHQAQQLQRQVYVSGRVKTMNESIYYNVDRLHAALAANRQITFFYFEYTLQKQRRLKNGGERYQASPLALCWEDENYYLIAYDERAGRVKHFRVDKMLQIEESELARSAEALPHIPDMDSYSRKTFDMFAGEERTVTLEMDNRLVGVALDRFGKDISLLPHGETHFRVTVEVAVSDRFFAWVFALGDGARIVSPPWAAQRMRALLQRALARHSEPLEDCHGH